MKKQTNVVWSVNDRLIAAITEYRERVPHVDPSHRSAFVMRLAKSYHLSLQTLRKAISMLRQLEN